MSAYKVVAQLVTPGVSGRDFRVLDLTKNTAQDVSLSQLHAYFGDQLQYGRCFIPEAVDYPVFLTVDGDHWTLPRVDSRSGECVEHDLILVVAQILQGGVLWGYRATDYSGGVQDISLAEALTYLEEGYWNAQQGEVNGVVQLVPTTRYPFAVISN